ncbi:MAG: excinuclease ABC subunit UvrA [bacterium]|nr:excinuclease ABC subunit UvrA [bacterium]
MDRIVIRGAREHNLKGIDLDLPRDRLIVVTGVSGSGKSSLAIDTLFAEGQRKYVESLSAYARQFLSQMQKPEVEHIEGLSPAIAIGQRPLGANPRSTVATVTEIHDYLRVLYARAGVPHCVACGGPVRRRTVQEMADEVLGMGDGRAVMVMARAVEEAKGDHAAMLRRFAQEGFVRVRVDGRLAEIEAAGRLDPRQPHTVDVVVDRLALREGIRNRLTDSLELALRLGGGEAIIGADAPAEERRFSERLSCGACGRGHRDLEPSGFSFNSPQGACPACHGLGRRLTFTREMIVDGGRSLAAGAIIPFRYAGSRSLALHYKRLLRAAARRYGFSLDVPFDRLERRWQEIVLRGSGGGPVTVRSRHGRRPRDRRAAFEGVIPILERRFRDTGSAYVREKFREFMVEIPCPECGGRRLRPEALAVTVGGESISAVAAMTVDRALAFFGGLELAGRDEAVGRELVREIAERLSFLRRVGLDYLTLDRESGTLSGGEAQRTRLATQIGAGLVGVLYILDEPSVGLHPRDTARLLDTLARLRDLGNTVVVIEHDEATIRAADYIVDLGPGAGVQGGRVVARGGVEEIVAAAESVTGQFLSGARRIPVPPRRRRPGKRRLSVIGAAHNNLRSIDVHFPLGVVCAVTGVSGAGKSSLVDETLRRALERHFHGAREQPGAHRELRGLDLIDKVVLIDQSPIGRTPRSNPATYTGVYTVIRDLFSRHPESRARGWKPGRFSFNVKGGRCEACRGDGLLRVEMHFLPDVYVPCEACGGRRYNRETLEVRFKGKSIADVLAMTVDEARLLFRAVPPLHRRLGVLAEVGLGYIALGQPATTLSGGEAQRVKLAAELGRVSTGNTLYILDEPTTGLHFADISALLDVLGRLVDAGNTVIVVEHNMEVVKCADWVIDLGPEGGEAGGRIVAEGAPEAVAACGASHTGRALRPYLRQAARKKKESTTDPTTVQS